MLDATHSMLGWVAVVVRAVWVLCHEGMGGCGQTGEAGRVTVQAVRHQTERFYRAF